MSLPVDSGGGSTFETLPLTPPRLNNNNSKSDEVSSASPRFSHLPRLHTERSFSFSHGHALASPSPLGGGSPAANPSPPHHHSSPPGESRFSRMANSPSTFVLPEGAYRGGISRNSSFNYASESKSRIMASPHASDKPPIPIFSRVASLKSSASFNRSLSSKEASAPHTLNRLLSMEKGENWRWSSNEEGNRSDFSFSNADMSNEVLETKSQYDGSLSLWKTWKQGSPASKKLMVVIALTFAYSATEFVFGLLTGRIGLVSDSFHLTFGCGVLTFSLYAMMSSKSRPDLKYTYGFNRVEVLAAFTNALFLLFLSFSLAVEALHAFVQDESEHKHYLIISAVANLTVNLLGVWFFRSYARVRVVYRKAEDMNNQSICLHVLSDSIRSAGVVLASWLLALGVRYAETLCLGLVAVAVFLTTIPLFKASGGVLLQMAPLGVSKSAFSKCQRQVTLLEEVIDCYKARFWDIVPGSVVGTLVLKVKAGSDEQKILRHVHSIYNDIGVKDLTVQLEFQQQQSVRS